MKPPLAYYGGKSRLAPLIASLLPPHRIYLEPFAGSAAVLFAKAPSTHEVLNDLDGDVVNFFTCLRDHPAELERACRLTPYSREEFLACLPRGEDLDPVERARRWWVRLVQSHSSNVTPWASWSVSVRRGSNSALTVRSYVDRMEAAAERLRTVSIEHKDALELIADYGVEPNVAMFVDPPYFEETRTVFKKRSKEYPHEFHKEHEHRALAEVLLATPAAVVLSGYGHPLYDELYADWWRIERRVPKPSANVRGRAGAFGIEVLWSNRPIADGALDLGITAEAPL